MRAINIINLQPIRHPKKILKGTSVGFSTCLGSNNCFDITVGKKNFRVLNFYLETLEALIKSKVVSWPISIIQVTPRHCIIHDHRIPDKEYRKDFCAVCSPPQFLSLAQQLQRFRALDSGRRTEKKFTITDPKGKKLTFTMASEPVVATTRKLKCRWSVEAKQDLRSAKVGIPLMLESSPLSPTFMKNPKGKILVPKK